MTSNAAKMSLGQYLVGASFNPSGNEQVDVIKARAAELIDWIALIPEPDRAADEMRFNEVRRCKATAITNIEQGAMWAVKAATKPPHGGNNNGA